MAGKRPVLSNDVPVSLLVVTQSLLCQFSAQPVAESACLQLSTCTALRMLNSII